jgi:NAD(P)-dependent dehydrogenase (short-subunit alcohol dehydrogenase family)
MGRLEGKVAVVLGAAARDNMGQVIARRLGREGARLVVGGRHADALAALAERARRQALDLRHHEEIRLSMRLRRSPPTLTGVVDIAINCTGWGLMAKLLETTEEQVDKLTALQFKGPYFFLQTFCALMSQSGGGSIVTISSASGVCTALQPCCIHRHQSRHRRARALLCERVRT